MSDHEGHYTSGNLKVHDRLQVAAFHSIYKVYRRRPAEERRSIEEDFMCAIVETSDDAFKDADQDKVQIWIDLYGGVRNRPTEKEHEQ